MQKNNKCNILLSLSAKDIHLKQWFDLAAKEERNRSKLIMSCVKYYKDTGKFLIIGNVHVKNEVAIGTEERKRLYSSSEFDDVYEWLKQQTNRPSSLVKKILSRCILTDATKEEYVLDELDAYQVVKGNGTLAISTEINQKFPMPTEHAIHAKPAEPEQKEQEKSPEITEKSNKEVPEVKESKKSTGDALMQALLTSSSGFKL